MSDQERQYLESYLTHQRAALCRTLNDEARRAHARLLLEGHDVNAIDALIEEQRQIFVREIEAHLTRTRNAVHGTRDRT
jgi:hypothetical protein